jgi:hypothetical protein
MGACFKQCPWSEVASFVMDSSRSRANWLISFLVYFVFVLLILGWACPNGGE